MIENPPGVIQSMPSQVPIANLQCWALKIPVFWPLGFKVGRLKQQRPFLVKRIKMCHVPVM